MASLTIKNIPDELYEQLKRSAKAHRRSINSELIVCLERALLSSKPSPADLLTTARSLRKLLRADLLDANEIDAAKREGRP